MTISNSTFADNFVVTASGGGLELFGEGTILNSTITGNKLGLAAAASPVAE